MTAPAHPALALAGRWRLTRRIEDFHAGADAQFHGAALLSADPGPGRLAPPAPGVGPAAAAPVANDAPLPDAARLRWAEDGVLRMAGAETRAQRVYLWRLAAPDAVDVDHADGRFFHRFVMTPGALAQVRHNCAPDLYEGAYSFETTDRWTLVWRVRGPRKNYRMTTEHLRIG